METMTDEDLPEPPDLPEEAELGEPERPAKAVRRRRRSKARSTSSDSSSASQGQQPRSSAAGDRFAPSWEKQIRNGYRDAMVLVGGATLLALPITGTVVVHRSDQTADVLVRLARTDERIRAALLAILKYGTFLELITIVGSIGLAANVDLYIRTQGKQGITPDNPAVGLLIGEEVRQVIAAANAAAGETPSPANGQAGAWAGPPAAGVRSES